MASLGLIGVLPLSLLLPPMAQHATVRGPASGCSAWPFSSDSRAQICMKISDRYRRDINEQLITLGASGNGTKRELAKGLARRRDALLEDSTPSVTAWTQLKQEILTEMPPLPQPPKLPPPPSPPPRPPTRTSASSRLPPPPSPPLPPPWSSPWPPPPPPPPSLPGAWVVASGLAKLKRSADSAAPRLTSALKKLPAGEKVAALTEAGPSQVVVPSALAVCAGACAAAVGWVRRVVIPVASSVRVHVDIVEER